MSERRALLKAALLTPVALALRTTCAEATDYASAAEVFESIDRLEADAAARLRRLGRQSPAARAFAASALADHERHRRVRARQRARLRLGAAAVATAAESEDASLAGLRAAQEALVYAHAEGCPALGEELAVHELMANMVDLARHLSVIDLWIEREEARG